MRILKRLFRTVRRSFVFVGLLALVLVTPVASVSAKAGDSAEAVEPFASDVFVIVGSTLRHPDDPMIPPPAADAPLFNVAGVALNVTWGQWQAATATATATVKKQESATEIKIELAGLIPGGVYSVFYGTLNPDTNNPLCLGVERTLPLITNTAKGPDASSFIASNTGQATYKGEADGDLLNTFGQEVFYSIIYHLDGATYHPLPNHGEFNTQGENCHSSFGDDAMRQLIIIQKFQ